MSQRVNFFSQIIRELDEEIGCNFTCAVCALYSTYKHAVWISHDWGEVDILVHFIVKKKVKINKQQEDMIVIIDLF